MCVVGWGVRVPEEKIREWRETDEFEDIPWFVYRKIKEAGLDLEGSFELVYSYYFENDYVLLANPVTFYGLDVGIFEVDVSVARLSFTDFRKVLGVLGFGSVDDIRFYVCPYPFTD